MNKAIKLLVSGFESSGKSTLTSKIKDSLVINFDRKEYCFDNPNSDFKDYEGVESVINFINEKLRAYKERFGEFPKVLVLDTITQLYTALVRYNNNKYSGFNIHSGINRDTLEINAYIEDVLIPNGVSVVIVAHTNTDATGRQTIPAQGSFRDHGSWVSVTNEAIFIDKSTGKLVVHLKSFKHPARSVIDVPDKMSIEEFDINSYIDKLMSQKDRSNKNKL